ncbi:MAG: hypothetical protein Q9207_005563 [Kuettlingeria erythrocarpa]
MATSPVTKQLSQVMRAEFERSLCVRTHLRHRGLFSSASSFRLSSTITFLSATSQRIRLTNPTAVTRRDSPPRVCQYADRSRNFMASTAAPAAIVTANPRTDEDGNEMLIDITERASTRLQEIMTRESNPSLALRVTVESGGCHGFQYLMSLTNMSSVSPEDDTVFEAGNGSGAKVVMDEPSLELLKGSKVDFTMELIGSQFKIVGNPAATSSCGCGTSFDIKP